MVITDSAVGCTLRSQTRRYDAYPGAWLSCVMHTAESNSAVRRTLRSLTQWCDAHRGVDSAVGCTLRSFLKNFDHLTLWCDAHRGAWLHGGMHNAQLDSAVWCTPRSFLKIWISRQNRNRIQKYFSLFIKGLDGFESLKKLRLKILGHTPFNTFLFMHLSFMAVLLCISAVP